MFIHKKTDARFNTLKDLFKIGNRVYDLNDSPNFKLLEIPLKFNKNIINLLKTKSINYLKKNIKT